MLSKLKAENTIFGKSCHRSCFHPKLKNRHYFVFQMFWISVSIVFLASTASKAMASSESNQARTDKGFFFCLHLPQKSSHLKWDAVLIYLAF